MAKLGFTFYPKDWWTSETFFELEPIERYLYLEIMFLMYQNDGYFTLTKTQLERRLITQIKPSEWEKITQLLTQTELGYTHSSVKKRRSKADVSRENGKLGGRPPKPRNPEINPPLEYKEKEKIKEIEIIKEDYLLNGKLVEAVLGNKELGLKDKNHLEVNLTKFNEMLSSQGLFSRPTDEYTKHFLNWLKKNKVTQKKKTNIAF